MMHYTAITATARAQGQCTLAIPASNLSSTFKGQAGTYLMCSVTGNVCRKADHCTGLILEALHKGLAGRNADMLGG